MSQKKLDLPEIMRGEAAELKKARTATDYVPDDVFGYTFTPDSSVTADCAEYAARRN